LESLFSTGVRVEREEENSGQMKTLTKVLGIEPSWSRFLWKWLDRIMTLRYLRQYDKALETLFDLFDFMPRDVHKVLSDEFKAAKSKYGAPYATPDDPFDKVFRSRKIRRSRAEGVICELLQHLQAELEKRGYLEHKTKEIPIGGGWS